MQLYFRRAKQLSISLVGAAHARGADRRGRARHGHALRRVLTSSSHVRADVIRQFHERGDDRIVDVLSDMETDELVRLQVIDALQRLT